MHRSALLSSCVLAPALGWIAAAPLGAQEPAADTVDLRPLPRANERYEVSESARWSDEIASLRLRSGEEVLLDIGAKADAASPGGAASGAGKPSAGKPGVGLGVRRVLSSERTFEDAVEAVNENDGASSITRLARTWRHLEASLRVDETGAERGRRVKRFESPLVGRTASLARGEAGAVTASLRPKPPTQGAEPPPEPPAADLALCALEARFETCLPPLPVARDASWPLTADAGRALLGNLDGYPFPRAEGYPGGIAEEARQADPLAVFLARGAFSGTARLESSDESTATIAIEIAVALDRTELYRSQAAAPKTDDPSAVGPTPSEPSQALPWSGELKARGRLVFDRSRRQVQSCSLTGEFELRLEASGAEGPAQIRLDLATKGKLERSARIFAISS